MHEVRKFAEQNGLIYFETSSFWDREKVIKEREKGGVGYLIHMMVEQIVRESMN